MADSGGKAPDSVDLATGSLPASTIAGGIRTLDFPRSLTLRML